MHASPWPCFWQFLFQKRAERNIKLVDPFDLTRFGPTTCVRMAYKAYQLSFPFSHDFYGIDPTDGTIAESQKKKVDEMAKWDNRPFHEYQCRRVRSHFVFRRSTAGSNVSTASKSGQIFHAATQCAERAALNTGETNARYTRSKLSYIYPMK